MIQYGDDFILTREELKGLFAVSNASVKARIINAIEEHAKATDRLTIINYATDLIAHLNTESHARQHH